MNKFKIYKNILSRKERKKLLQYVRERVSNIGDEFPGLQTHPNLHLEKEMNFFMEKIQKYFGEYSVSRCWANQTDGSYVAWHKHYENENFSTLSIVYYLKNPTGMGVMFNSLSDNNYHLIEYTKGIENSLIIFDNKLEHSIPNYPDRKIRYTIAIDLIKGE